MLNLLEAEKVDVIGGVDRMRNAVNLVRDRNAPSKNRIILDVVDHERGVVEHLHHFADTSKLVVGDSQPSVEGLFYDETIKEI